jgi:hypothetical protein
MKLLEFHIAPMRLVGNTLKPVALESRHDLQLPFSGALDDECHPFSSVSTISKDAFAVWESMIATIGLASRPPCSRTAT